MTPRFKQQLLRYWFAANAAAIQGGAITTKTFLTLAGANAAGVAVPTLNLQQAAYVFLGSVAYHLFDFLASHPLPVELPAPEKIFPPTTTSTEKPNT